MDETPHFLGPLSKPIYVIRLGWHRWGRTAQRRWLYILRAACLETIDEIDAELRRMRHG